MPEIALRSFLIAASIRNFRLKAERNPEIPEEKRFSYPAIRPESSLRAVRSCAIVEIPEKSFVAIEDADEEFHKNIREKFPPYEKENHEGKEEDAADGKCRGRPASDEITKEDDGTEGE